MEKGRIPLVGMKTKFPFQVSICCWVDLLGYGSAIKKAEFNPLNPLAKASVDRIRSFHQIVADHSARTFPTLVMNDGAIAYCDLSYRTPWPTYDFLQRAKALYDAVLSHERSMHLPGPRMVISTGFRMRGRSSQSSALRSEYVKKLIKELNQGKISSSEAITKASQFRRTFDIVPQLQTNFAFTKAYVAEQSGSNGGLPGPACYMDSLLVDEGDIVSTDIQLGRRVQWSSEKYGLSAEFVELLSVRAAKQTEFRKGVAVHHGPPGFRDAIHVAELLSGDGKILNALRKVRAEGRDYGHS